MFMRITSLSWVAAPALLAVGCSEAALPAVLKPAPPTAPATAKVVDYEPKLLTAEHLPNPWQIHPKVISGGLPEGEAAFRQLAELGVKTVVSVDGAQPDVALAKRHGLRYVHLPHGYNGISADRTRDLAKVVRDLPGIVYIHCHHGQHRSPAAAAVACVAGGLIDPARAEPFLVAAGTSANYKGLYESARSARPLDSKLLEELAADFPEVAKLPPLAEAMVGVEHTHDRLKVIAAAGWKSPPEHPDLEPAHEALLLREHFTELLRTPEVKQQPAPFQALLREGETAGQGLEDALQAWKAAGSSDPPPAAVTKAFELVSANCKACHIAYRDVPLGGQ